MAFAVGGVFIVAALALAGFAIWDNRTELARSLHRMSLLSVGGALVFGFVSVLCTFLMWQSTLSGFGVSLDRRESAQVYFLGQLGKYLPGAVWPILAQTAMARRHNVSRTTMATGGLLALVINTAVGALIACAVLPFVSPYALSHYWWLVLCVPVLIAMLHPRCILGSVNWLLRRADREQLAQTLSVRAEVIAAGWGLLSWTFLGGHVYFLESGLGVTGPRAFLTALAAGCLAVSAGILLVPVPAGAGVREIAFVLVLAPVLDRADAVLVALMSRLLLIVTDTSLAAFAAARISRSRSAGTGS